MAERVGHHGSRYQPDQLHVRGVLLAGVALLAVLGFIGALLWGWLSWMPGQTESRSVSAEHRPPSSPGLLENLPEVRRVLYRDQREGLVRYGWVDRERGIVQIPIDRAIQRMVSEGWPSFGGSDAATGEFDVDRRDAP